MGDGVKAASRSSIAIDFYFRGVRCRERVKLAPNDRNLQYCERWRAQILIEIEKGIFDYAKHFPDSPKAALFVAERGALMLLSDYLDTWLKASKTYTKASTYAGYKKIVNNQLVPAFGHLKLTELRRTHVKTWAADRKISAKTLGNIISPLRIALDEAVEDDLIQSNPLAGWKIKRRDGKRKTDKVDPFSHDERSAILAALDGQGLNLIEVAFWTGLRTSELCAIEWPDIDWINGYAYITKALTQAAAEAEEPKTAAGDRRVKLLPQAVAALKRQKALTFTAGAQVFHNPRTDKPWAGDQAIRKTLWVYALKRAGVRYRNPYQTRHTFASMMLMAGESVMWVAHQMGHADWTFTARTYSRFIPDDAPDAGSKAAAAWSIVGQPTKAKA